VTSRREIGSVYLEWAKLHSKARFGLAGSDVLHFPFSEGCGSLALDADPHRLTARHFSSLRRT
jgi:hypothetical protein